MSIKSLSCVVTAVALGVAGASNAAPTIDNSGLTVGGNTTTLNLNAGGIVDNPNNNTSLSNNGGNLVVTVANSPTNTDFYFTWSGAGDGVGFDASTYSYVQVDVAAVSPGLVTGVWQVFWSDNDSGIGGGNNSGTTVGAVDPTGGAPFSIVIDLVNGSNSGATGWGPGTVNNFRLDLFNNAPANAGQSWEISAITFGDALVPEPSSLALLGLGGLMVARRRR